MRQEEKGRYCSSCAKIVVDFSSMSDQQVIAYLSRAGQNVCGRLAPDQLGRDLPLRSGLLLGTARAKSRIGWWQLLLAGVLFAGKAAAQARPMGAQVSVVRTKLADVVSPVLPAPAKDSFKVLPAAEVVAWRPKPFCGRLGGLSVVGIKMTAWQKIKDTLQILPKQALSVYPNPARRGMPVSIAWQTEGGEYSVGLYNTAGALIQQWIKQVANPSQVDLVEIPASLPAGIYFLRTMRAGGTKVNTRKLSIF
jgi:hypothetical protein